VKRKDYLRCKFKGLCSDCGRPVRNNKSRCSDCLHKINQRYRVQRISRRCSCGNPTVRGLHKCPECKVKIRERYFKKIEDRANKGLCRDCGKNPICVGRSKNRCVSCLDYEQARKVKDKALIKFRNKKDRMLLKIKVYEAYGGFVRACCGETEPNFLSIDHINNDGREHAITYRGTDRLHRYLLKNKFPEGFRILCHNCNHGRYLNGGECPHENSKINKANTKPKTDYENYPAFWAAVEKGVELISYKLLNILDGKNRGNGPAYQSPVMETVKRKIIELQLIARSVQEK
jgi:hypothetical protein